jgi:hypothetical protein
MKAMYSFEKSVYINPVPPSHTIQKTSILNTIAVITYPARFLLMPNVELTAFGVKMLNELSAN